MKFDGDFWYFWFVARLDVALQDFFFWLNASVFGIQGCLVGDDYETCKRKMYDVVIESIEFDVRIYLWYDWIWEIGFWRICWYFVDI